MLSLRLREIYQNIFIFLSLLKKYKASYEYIADG